MIKLVKDFDRALEKVSELKKWMRRFRGQRQARQSQQHFLEAKEDLRRFRVDIEDTVKVSRLLINLRSMKFESEKVESYTERHMTSRRKESRSKIIFTTYRPCEVDWRARNVCLSRIKYPIISIF